nr:glycosyltransferase family 4 protein [Providencia sneebia]
MKKYNIAFIDPQSYSNLEKYDSGVLSEFHNQNCTFYCSNNLSQTSNFKTVKVERIFKYSSKSNKIASLISYIYSMILLFIRLIKTKPDIIHIQWIKLLAFDFFIYYSLKKILPNSKFIFTAHNIKPHNCSNFYFYFYKKIYNIFDVIIVHSLFTKKALLSINDKLSINVIPHGLIPLIDDDSINFDISQIFSKKKLTFCFIGRASHYKGIDLLLNSWEKSFNNNNEIQLIIAGRIDNKFKHLKNKLWNNVIFIDRFLNETELKFIINNSFFVYYLIEKYLKAVFYWRCCHIIYLW